MRIHSLVPLVAASGLAACLFPTGSTTPNPDEPPKLDTTFGSYVALARHDDAGFTQADGTRYGNGYTIGRLPSITAPATDYSDERYSRVAMAAYPGMTVYSLVYEGIVDGRICFSDSRRGVKSYESAEGAGREMITNYNVTVEVLDNLDAVATRPLLPSPGIKLDTAEAVSEEIVDKDTDYGTIERVREIEWKVCGAAPEITPQSKYIAVVVHNNDPNVDETGKPTGVGDDALLLWEVVR